jgi:Transglutaminase-like superfamily
MLDWPKLIGYTDTQLAKMDIAALNLACAQGLPGMEKYDPAQSIRVIDEMAWRVVCTTRYQTSEFTKHPEKFQHSYDYFRALVLITVIQRDFGVRYDQAKIPDHVPFAAEDSFLFRLIKTRLGTCANMPVLYVAVGRRLGYPMKLVQAKGQGATHLFARWDAPNGSRFNIEATDQGMRTPADDYYRTGRYSITPQVEKMGCFLKSLTPREELSCILTERGLHLWDDRCYLRATAALCWACVLAPHNELQLNTVKMATNEWLCTQRDRSPNHFPRVCIASKSRRFPDGFPGSVLISCWPS